MTGSGYDEVRATAAEAWMYGHPMLENYRTVYVQAVDETSPSYIGFGRFGHHSQPFTPDDTDWVTPNNDTPYSQCWLDLRAEPWVVTVPAMDRYYLVPFHDLDTTYIGFIGSRTTGQDSGDYLLAGPGWDGAVPPGISGVLRADTYLIGSLVRTSLAGPDDVPALQEIQAQYQLRPLSEFSGHAAPPAAAPVVWPTWDEAASTGLGFFAMLDFLLGFFPVLPDQQDLRSRLAEFGVDGSGGFDPGRLSDETRRALEDGTTDGRAQLSAAMQKRTASVGLFGTRAELGNDYLARSIGADLGIYGLPEYEAWYGTWRVDDQGNPPDASEHDYIIRFPAGQLPPGRFFWSATMYRLPERLLVANPIKRYSIGDRTPDLSYDDDGGLTVTIQRTRPSDDGAARNWLPAPAGPFSVVIRMYGPDQSVLDGSWQMPALHAV